MKNFVEIIAENSQDIQKIKMSRIDIKQNKNGDTDLDSVLQYINNLTDNIQSNITRTNQLCNEYTRDISNGIQRQIEELNKRIEDLEKK